MNTLFAITLFVGVAAALANETGGSCQFACSEQFGTDIGSETTFACSRGCRFSAINQFLSVGRPDGKSNSECDENCKNSYADDKLMRSCSFGCNSQGMLSPLGQMLESQPNFGADPILSPATFFDAVSSFIDDFSSAVSNRMPLTNQDSGIMMRPVGVVRVISHNFPDSPQTRVISVKLSSKNGNPIDDFFNSDPFGNDVDSDASSERQDFPNTNMFIKSSASMGSSRCLAPTYSTLPGPKCRAYMPRYQWNKLAGKCEQFIYGGCGAVENIFSSQQECETACSQFAERREMFDQSGRSFEMWLLTFSFAALGICALLGAVSSACLYCCRRRRQRSAQSYIRNDAESKIFLVAPRMSWGSDSKAPIMTMPPTYEQVLAAAQDQISEPKKSVDMTVA